MPEMREILGRAPVLPVVTVADAAQAVPLAQALLAGGIGVIEVTLRTPAALEAVRAIAQRVSGMIVGVGTITRPQEIADARAAGAAFAVSPGFTFELGAAACVSGLPYLPGVATPGEVMAARAAGFLLLKFFPAHVAGGVAALKAMAPVFPDVRFCPTGGIGLDDLAGYLGLDNVIAVGGSWLAPAELIARGDFPAITERAREALSVARTLAPSIRC